MNLLQLAPFAMLLLVSLLSSLPIGGESTPYSLRPMDKYTLPRATEAHGIQYFVDESFELWYDDAKSLRDVELKVEADNLQRVRRKCSAERISKQKMVDAANHRKGDERAKMFDKIDTVRMKWCDEQDRLQAMKAGTG